MDAKERVVEKLKSRGLKITPQRLAIIEVLEGNRSHPSAEDVYRELVRKYPTISYATIYKTLETLCEMGEIMEVNIEPHKKRYDPFPDPHHHYMCVKCGKILDISTDEVPMPRVSQEVKEKYGIVGMSLNFYGICSSCRN